MDNRQFLNELFINRDIYPYEIDYVFKEREIEIKNIDKIFDANSAEDFTLMKAILKIFGDSNYIDKMNYFIEENFENQNFTNSKEPDKKDEVFVAACLWYNPSFFSMAYNWIRLIDSRQENKSKKDENIIEIAFNDNEYDYCEAASTDGFRGFGKIKNTDIGNIEIQYDSEDKDLCFYLEVSDNYVNMNFEVTIKYKFSDEKSEYLANIVHSAGRSKAYSKPKTIELGERGILITSLVFKKK